MVGNHIRTFLDGTKTIDVVDNSYGGLPAYTNGGIAIHLYTPANQWVATFDNVRVTTVPLSADDSYGVVKNRTLNVPAPGVLSNDEVGIGTNLTATLVSGTTHGSLTLNADGSFTYVPNNNYLGADSFTYFANDGISNSTTAQVAISVHTNGIPVAFNDAYYVSANHTLTVADPGVLGNDTDSDNDSLTATLVAGPSHGTLNLNAAGGFVYNPSNNFSGLDSFSYQPSDGSASGNTANVALRVFEPGSYFSDDFTRLSGDTSPLSPWISAAGTWTPTNGTLEGSAPASSYGLVYLTNVWGDYAVRAQVRFPAGAVGGGIDARVDTATGARYAAWIYPETSPGGNGTLRLIKFQSLTQWGYNGVGFTGIQTVTLPTVGTNWHSLMVAVVTNHISVFYDGSQLINADDAEVQPYLTGGVGADFYRDTADLRMSIDDLVVTPLAKDDQFTVSENSTLTIPAAGVLTNDLQVYGLGLSAVLGTGPAHGSLTLNADGSFVYTPSADFVGTDSFTYQALDGSHPLGTATVTVTSTPVLVVTANNVSRSYGSSNPSFTGTLAGLLPGDTITATYSSTANNHSPIGTYAI
ncbi:MAG TPA: Ig-like domain-containing protein, partial [Verrucomicrobiae bacterium]|nr:Ig-like domain-containing protein [Verrucomicrobiae bacterium]